MRAITGWGAREADQSRAGEASLLRRPARALSHVGAAVVTISVIAGCGPQPLYDAPLGLRLSLGNRIVFVDPPPATESLRHAVERIRHLLRGDCTGVTSVLVQYNTATSKTLAPAACNGLKELDAYRVAGEAEYGGQAALVDLRGPHPRTLVMLRRQDGTYGLVLATGIPKTTRVVGTAPDMAAIDATLSQVMTALRNRDCRAYAKLVYRELQPGKSGDPAKICAPLEGSTLPSVLRRFRAIQPVLLGADAGWAFFTLRVPDAYVDGVLVAQPTTGYALLRLFVANKVAGYR